MPTLSPCSFVFGLVVSCALLVGCGAEPRAAQQRPRVKPPQGGPGTGAIQDPVAAQGPGPVDPAPPSVQSPSTFGAPTEPKPVEGLETFGTPRADSPAAARFDWPTFLGPARDGLCHETGLDLDWEQAVSDRGDSLRPLWSMERGIGYTSPAVSGDHLVYVHRIDSNVVIDCLVAQTGQRYWRFEYPTPYRSRYGGGDGPRSSATIDPAGRVYVHGVEGMLHCLDLATGSVVWKRDLADEFDLVENFFGVVSSPLLHDGKLFVNLGASDGRCVAAFDAATGRLVDGCGDGWGASCASPVLARDARTGQQSLFVLAGGKSRPPTGGLLVCPLADGLRVRASHPFRSRSYASVTATSPLVDPDGAWVFLSAGYGVGSTMLGLGGDGDRMTTWWTNDEIALEFSNAVVVDGVLYAFANDGKMSTSLLAIDPRSGDELSRLSLDWEADVVLRDGEQPRRLQESVGRGSLLGLVGGDRRELLCLGAGGHLLRIALPREGGPDAPEILSRIVPFRAPESWTPPVISGGLMFLCQNNREAYGEGRSARLWCFDVRARP